MRVYGKGVKISKSKQPGQELNRRHYEVNYYIKVHNSYLYCAAIFFVTAILTIECLMLLPSLKQ